MPRDLEVGTGACPLFLIDFLERPETKSRISFHQYTEYMTSLLHNRMGQVSKSTRPARDRARHERGESDWDRGYFRTTTMHDFKPGNPSDSDELSMHTASKAGSFNWSELVIIRCSALPLRNSITPSATPK